MSPKSSLHISRSWSDTRLEDACPCPKAACGFVDTAQVDPECPEHPMRRAKTIRRGHDAKDCPGIATSDKECVHAFAVLPDGCSEDVCISCGQRFGL